MLAERRLKDGLNKTIRERGDRRYGCGIIMRDKRRREVYQKEGSGVALWGGGEGSRVKTSMSLCECERNRTMT